MKLTQPTHIVLFFLMLFCVSNIHGQSKKQQELEARRQEILKEIKQYNLLLTTDKKKERSMVSLVEDLNNKVRVRQNLIKITNDQANLLTREINTNQKEISSLRDQLTELKGDYAAMVVKSYKSKSEQSRVMFLLSSDNFQQAYKRLQYIRQYTKYQEQQGIEIKGKTEKLQDLNTSLLKQKKDKEKLIEENRIAKRELETDVKAQQELVASVRKNIGNYASQIKTKQQEADKIDREIDRMIKEAIAEANRIAVKNNKSNKTTTSTSKPTSTGFALTPEAKALAANFEANKGKLSWPVEKGVVKTRYGIQPSPIDPSISFQSTGVRIATDEHSKVRAVFQGTVIGVMVSKTGNPTVLIQHGNYFTAYKNLSKVYVKKGDKVDTKQSIGEVFTSSGEHETILSFSIYKVVGGESQTQDPSGWIYQM